MYKCINIKKHIVALAVLLFAFFAFYVAALDAFAYVPLEPSIVSGSKNVSPDDYIKNIYQIGIGIAGALAVLMIVIGGIKYIGSAANPSLKGDAKSQIWAAIGGLILALMSYIILNTINPKLVDFDLGLKKVDIKVMEKDKYEDIRDECIEAKKKLSTITETCSKVLDKDRCIKTTGRRYYDIKEKCNNAQLEDSFNRSY